MQQESNHKRAIYIMLISAFFGAVMTGIVRQMGDLGLPSMQIIFVRMVMGLAILMPWWYRRHKLRLPKTRHMKLYLLRTIIGITSMYLWFNCLTHIDLSTATAISFLAPIFTLILVQVFLQEKMQPRTIISMGIVFVGVLIISQPVGASGGYLVMMLVATFLWGGANVIIRKTATDDGAMTTTLYMLLLMVPISGIIAIFGWEEMSWEAWLWAVMLGLASNLMQTSLAMSFKMAPFSVVLPWDFSRLIFVSFFGWGFFAQEIDIWTFIGAAIIMLGAIFSQKSVGNLEKI